MPDGGPIAQASVELVVDGSNLGKDVRSSVEKAGADASSAAQTAGSDAGQSMGQSMTDKLSSYGGKMSDTGEQLSTKVSLPLAGVGGTALKMSGDFEASMNKVSAISGATGDELGQMEELAKQMGSTTSFSASEAADAMGYLSMAGFDTQESMQALPDTMNLAAAGGMNLADAADTASNILSGYGKQADELGNVNDVLAKTFTSTNTDMSMLGESFKMVGPVASSAGLQFEEVSAAIGQLGNAGIQGSEAGTALRSSISMLLNPSNQAQEAMDRLGISVTDSQGNLKSLTDIVGQLETSGADTADMMTIFGQEAGPAMSSLVSQGSDSLRDLTGELENSGGTAEGIASKQMEGFNGSMKELQSAFEGLMIAIGQSGLLDFLTQMVGGLTGVLQSASQASPGLMKVAVAAGAIAAAVGPATLIIGKMATGLAQAIGVFGKLGGAIKVAAGAFRALSVAMLTNPIGIIVVAITGLVAAFVLLWNKSEAFRNFWIGLWQQIQTAAQPVLDWFRNAWSGLVAWWTGVWARMRGPVMAALGAIGGFIQGQLAMWRGIFAGAMTAVQGVLGGAWSAIQGVISGALSVIQGLFQVFTGLLTGNWSRAWNGIQNIVMGVWTAIQGVVSGALSALQGIISGALSAIRAIFTSIWNGLVSLVTGAWNGITSAVSSGVSSVINAVRELPGRIKSFFADAGSWLLEAGKNIIQGLIDGIKGMVGKVGGAIKGVAGKIRDFLPFSPAKEGPLSGSGAPIHSGRSIGRQIATGIASQRGAVAREMRALAAAADMPKLATRAPQLAGGRISGTTPELAAAQRQVHALTRNHNTNRTAQKNVEVHAPITVSTAARDPQIVARRTANQLSRAVQG